MDIHSTGDTNERKENYGMTQNKMVWLGSGKYRESKTGKKQKRRIKTPWSIVLLEKLIVP